MIDINNQSFTVENLGVDNMQEETSRTDLIQLRETLHSIPEKSGYEKKTVSILNSFFSKTGNHNIISKIGGNSFGVIIDSEKNGPSIVIRCELDAVTYLEANNEKVKHICGHDGHMTILASLALKLQNYKDLKGKVMLLYQEAEENAQGAKKVVKNKDFKSFNPDFVFALHNIPGYKKSSVLVKDKRFASSSAGIKIKLTGKESHAGEPQAGNNPDRVISKIINLCNDITYDKSESIVTVVNISLGRPSFGVNPGSGQVLLTARDPEYNKLTTLIDNLKNNVINICKVLEISPEFSLHEVFKDVNNDIVCNKIIRQAALKTGLDTIELPKPFGWSEDFSEFTDIYKGSLFGFGSGTNQPPLHNVNYVFPDEIIEDGASLFFEIIKETVNYFE